MRLWLDDIRNPADFGHACWVWVKTAREAIDALLTGRVSEASLDHDLTPEQMYGDVYGQPKADGQQSGYDVVCWLEEHPEFWPPEGVVVHSTNPSGRYRMEQVIARHYGRGKACC